MVFSLHLLPALQIAGGPVFGWRRWLGIRAVIHTHGLEYIPPHELIIGYTGSIHHDQLGDGCSPTGIDISRSGYGDRSYRVGVCRYFPIQHLLHRGKAVCLFITGKSMYAQPSGMTEEVP